MRMTNVIDRLKDQVPDFKTVDDLLDLRDLDKATAKFPAAFVVALEEKAEKGKLVGGTRQNGHSTIGVVIGVATAQLNERRKKDQLSDLKKAVGAAVMGWKHPDAAGPFEYLGGKLIAISDTAAWWQSNFTATEDFEGATS